LLFAGIWQAPALVTNNLLADPILHIALQPKAVKKASIDKPADPIGLRHTVKKAIKPVSIKNTKIKPLKKKRLARLVKTKKKVNIEQVKKQMRPKKISAAMVKSTSVEKIISDQIPIISNQTKKLAQSISLTTAQNAHRHHVEQAYKQQISMQINLQKQYPLRARRRGQQGRVEITFLIYANGRIEEIQILQSAGVKSLDKSARQAVQAISGQYPFPTEITRSQWQFSIKISYELS